MGFFVKLWGTRGSIPTPGRAMERYGGNTTCIEVRIDDTLFICDAGTGLRELGVDLLQRSNDPISAHWLFSHTHWDHIQGFPLFQPAFKFTKDQLDRPQGFRHPGCSACTHTASLFIG